MFVLHYTPDTAAFAVRLVLAELDLPHVMRLIDRAAGGLDAPSYRAMHPLGKIPVLETPDGPMFETAAILLWLADRHAPGHLAPAPDSRDRAAFLSWLFFTSTNLHPAVMEVHYPERIAGADAVPAVYAQGRGRVLACLAALERTAAAALAWLSADRPGILGIYVLMLMRWLATFPPDHPGYVPLSDHPHLARIGAMLEMRPSIRAAAVDEGLGPRPFTDPTA